MKGLATLALLRLPTCLCFAGAIYLLAIGVTSGWGWLIFAGILCCGSSFSYKENDCDKGKVKE